MKVYNENKTKELKDFDLSKGFLKFDKLSIDKNKFIPIKVFVPYNEEQLAKKQISKLKKQLAESDYKAIKFAEGEISAEEYAPIKAERQAMRAEINRLEKSL